MAKNAVVCAGLKLCEPLICVGLKAVLRIPDGVVDAGMKWLKGRFTDHSLVLTKAVTTAHDRAWQAVALALAPDTIFSHIANLFRDGDLKAVQKQIREFVATADTGLDGAAAGLRTKACDELLRLKGGGRFGIDGADLTSLDLTRFASAAKVADDAHRAIQHIAADLTADAPHLAQVLTLTPQGGGTPLLAAAFAYFLRRQIATDAELARDLTFDQLRLLTLKQQAGFDNLEQVIGSKSGELLEVLGGWFATTGADLDDIKAKLEQLLEQHQVSKKAESPLRVSVTSEAELQRLKKLRDRLRGQPVELVDAELQSLLGDGLAAAGQYADAEKAHGAAVIAAHAVADATAEADAAYKQFKDACELGQWDAALTALRRAVALDERRFRPVPKHYAIDAILGMGSFGVVFKCRDLAERGEEGEHVTVAVKTFRAADLDRPLDEVFAEASVLKRLGHDNIVAIHERGFADPENQQRPFLAMEFVPGVTLEHYLNTHGTMTVADFAAVFHQIAAALHAAHSGRRPIIHRDLKPANVMVWKSSFRFLADCWGWRGLAESYFGSPLPLHGWGGDSMMGFHLGFLAGLHDQEELARHLLDQIRDNPAVCAEVTRELNALRPPHLQVQRNGDQPPYDTQTQEEAIEAGASLAVSKLPPPDDDSWGVKVIDFGLAVRSATRTASLRTPSVFRSSRELCVAGTVKYAAPEQLGERPYPVGPHSDVFAFGKTALEALLGTTQPTPKHWKKLPDWLAEMLGRCVDEDYLTDNPDEGRFHNFEPILEILTNPPPATPPTPLVPPPLHTNPPIQPFTDADLASLGALGDAFAAEGRASATNPTKHRTACPLCRARFKFPPKRGGERVKCPQCGMWLILPTQDGGTAIISPSPAPEAVKQARKAGDKLFLPLPGGLWMAFAWCPPGTFLMGSPASEEDHQDEELQHEVRLTKGFYAGVHPVTRGEFARFVAQTNYKTEAETRGGGYKWTGSEWKLDASTNWRNPGYTQADDHPVTVVSWDDAVAFCKWMADESKQKVRLPTEAEWEYACRGGTTTPFYWGGELDGTQANCDGELPYGTSTEGPNLDETSPVGNYANRFPHPWGLTDVHGNVWEWCSDWSDKGFYARSPKDDPECRDSEQKSRILRGGSWLYHASVCRAAYRNRRGPADCDSDDGFRVVFCLDEIPAAAPPTPPPVSNAMPVATAPPTPPSPDTNPTDRAVSRSATPTATAVRNAGDKFYLPLPGGLKMAFAWCPPGTFLMGSPEWEEGRNDDEQQHEVRLTKGFYAGVHPVTQTEWVAVMNTDPSHFKGANLPVEKVSWDDAQAFCQKVHELTGKGVRLPTEAAWEYACRGGTTTPFYWGRELNGTQANCQGNYPYGTSAKGPYLKATSPVGSFAKKFPHPWGLTDLHANVSEWCVDWYDEGYYARSPKGDPECRDGEQKFRIIRGGSWDDIAWFCRAAFRRFGDLPSRRRNDLGFRVVFCLD